MAVTAAQLIANVQVQGVSQAKSELSGMGNAVKETGSGFKSMLGNALSFATGQAIFTAAGNAIGFLKDQTVDAIKVAMAHQDIMAQTNSVLKSTHDVSGMSAQGVQSLAESLSKVTPYSEDVTQSAENMLLTFTNIGSKVFPQATQTALDMAQALHMGPEQASIMLGKALGNPLTGFTALQRVGVTFSDAEKQQIKTAMAHNDIMGAQKVILNELGTEFGGSATAAGKTFSGQMAILKNTFEDLKIKIGSAVLPILSQLMGYVTGTILPGLENFGNFISDTFKNLDFTQVTYSFKQLGGTIGSIFSQISKTLSGVFSNVGGGQDPAQTIGKSWNQVSQIVSNVVNTINDALKHVDVKAIINGFQQVFDVLTKLSPQANIIQAIASHAQDLGKWFQTSVVPAMKEAEPGFKNLLDAGKQLWPVIQQIADTVHNTFQKAFDALLPVFEKAIPLIIRIAGIIADGLGSALKFLAPYISQAVKALGEFASEIAERVAPIVEKWLDQVSQGLDAFMKIWNAVWPSLAPILKGVWDIIVGVIKVAWAIVSGVIKIGLDILSGNWRQAWQDMQDMLKGIWDGIKTMLSGVWETLKGIFMAGVNAVIAAIRPMLEAMANIPGPAGDMARGVLKSFDDMKNGAAKSAIDMKAQTVNQAIEMHAKMAGEFDKQRVDLIKQIQDTSDPVKKHALEMKLGVVTQAENMQKEAVDHAEQMKTQLVAKTKSMSDQSVSNTKTMHDQSGNWFTSLSSNAQKTISSMWSGITGAFSGAWGGISGALTGLGRNISSWFNGLVKDATKWGSDLINNIISGINGAVGGVGKAAQDAAGAIAKFLHFSKPDEGPLASIDEWIPDMTNILETGFKAQASRLGKVASSVASNIAAPITSITSPSNITSGSALPYQLPSLTSTAPVQVTVQAPPVYLDGRILAGGLMPHITNAIRYNVGTHTY